MTDPFLFKRTFGGRSWATWRVLLKAIFALPLEGEELKTYRYHTHRQHPPEKLQRESCWVVGRRGGKSRILALLAVFKTAFADYSQWLAPGEAAVAAIIAADREQAKTILNYARGLLQTNDMLAEELEEDFAETLVLRNGNKIAIFTASLSAPRGRTFCLVCADELAFFKKDGRNVDAEILSAVRPGLLTLPGSMLVMASSVYDKRGALWETFSRNFGREDAKVLTWLGTTVEMNPKADMEFLAEEQEKDPLSYGAEYCCVWRLDVASYVSKEIVDAVTSPDCFELPCVAGISYFAACDMSGGVSDSSVLAIGHREADMAVIDLILEVMAPHSPAAAVEKFCTVMKSYGVGVVIGDNYAGQAIKEQFMAKGVRYSPSELNRSDTYAELLPILTTRKVRLLDNHRLTNQLCNLERRTGSSGKDVIDHMRGQHDDIANTVALLTVALHTGARSKEVWRRLGEASGVMRPRSAFGFVGFI